MKKKYFNSYDNEKIPYLEYENNNKKKVLILHNVLEHIYRYDEFAKFLNENGVDVYIIEYREHGELLINNVANFGPEGLTGVLKDIKLFIKHKFSNIDYNDLIILSQGYGSIINLYLLENIPLRNSILLSTPIEKKFSIFLGKIITSIEMKLNFKVSILPKLINLKKDDNNLWLNRNKEEYIKCMEDDRIYKLISPKYINSFLNLISYVKKNINKISMNANIFLILGTGDPLCSESKIKKYMNKINNNNRKIKILKIKKARHDLLHGNNKKEIFEEILKYINKI